MWVVEPNRGGIREGIATAASGVPSHGRQVGVLVGRGADHPRNQCVHVTPLGGRRLERIRRVSSG